MPLSTDEFRDTIPGFDDLPVDASIAVNETTYTISHKETQSPSPGETVYVLELQREGDTQVLSWSEGHTVETIWLHPKGSDPMTDGVEVKSIEYHGETP